MEIIKFSADWCSPCKTYWPIFTEVMEENPEVKSRSINVEKEMDFAWKHRIMSIPATIILDDEGKEVFRKIWVIPKKELKGIINEYFKS
jgi:thioredoxin 2